MDYEDILYEMSSKGVKYLVVGGYGVVFSGYMRTTMDMDLLVDLHTDNLKKIITILEKYGYIPKVPVKLRDILNPAKRKSWHDDKGMVAFMLYHPKRPLNKIDLLIYSGDLNFDDAFTRKQVIQHGNNVIYIASIDDLIKLKKSANRPKDIDDIINLERIKELQDEKEK